MALSFYSNWDSLQRSQETLGNFQAQPELLPPELFSFYNDFNSSFSCLDPIFESETSFICPENLTNLLPINDFSFPPNDLISYQPEAVDPNLDFEPYQCPKRQKFYEDNFCPDFKPQYFDGYADNFAHPVVVPEFSPEFLLPDVQVPPVFSSGSMKKPSNNNGGLSAQSIAARQRRKRIAEKTQELGKLIPGGDKMNTAEMFQAAFKYVKFLQAQIGVLKYMRSIENIEEPFNVEDLGVLAASSIVQEKLYSDEKCLVPTKGFETLVNDQNLQFNPSIFKEIQKLAEING